MTLQRNYAERLDNANEELRPYRFAVVHLEFPADASKLLRGGFFTDFFRAHACFGVRPARKGKAKQQ